MHTVKHALLAIVFTMICGTPVPAQTNTLAQILRDAVAANAMTVDHASEIYFAYVYPGSPAEQRIEDHASRANKEIDILLDAELISTTQAERSRARLRKTISHNRDLAFAADVRAMSSADVFIEKEQQRLNALVTQGKLTRDAADAKVAAIRHSVKPATSHDIAKDRPSRVPLILEHTAHMRNNGC